MSEIVVTFGDIETTGLSQAAGHRIIEVALSCWAFNPATQDKRKLGKTWVQRINPHRAIDPAAEAVHKISLAMLRGAPKWEDVAPTVNRILGKTKLFVAHNVNFDAPFLGMELIRIGEPLPTFDVYCTMQEGRLATGFGKVPNLGELAYAFGIEYDPDAAHSASYDTEILEQCYWAGVKNGMYKSPADV